MTFESKNKEEIQMNTAFIFNGNNEDRSEYLARMAKVIDSIHTGRVIPEIGKNYKETLNEDEKNEIQNYVFEVMLPIIKEEGNFYIKKAGLRDVAEIYLNQLYLEVWKNFHKFNNPIYRDMDVNCAFRTFVKVYTKEPARKTLNSENGQSKHFGYKKNIISKTQKYITVNYGLDTEDITPELIHEFLPEVSTTQLSVEDITNTLKLMQARVSMEDCENHSEFSTEMDELFIATENVMNAFKVFMDKLRPLQKFIFCQNYGFCSHKYDDITLEQLVCDPDFIKIVKEDHIGTKHLISSDMEIKEPRVNGFGLRKPMHLSDVEHIDVNFVTHQRVRCNKLVIEFVNDNKFDEYDVRANLAVLMRSVWDELAAHYGLQ
jgi:hypothetical protein